VAGWGERRYPARSFQRAMSDSPFVPLYDLPAHLFRRSFQRMSALFDREIGPLGITAPQLALLVALRLREGQEQRELARAVGFDEAATGGILNRLLKLRLVQRERSPRSRRGWEIFLSAGGRELCDRVAPRLEQLQRVTLEPLDAREQEQLLRLLSKLNGTENSYYSAVAVKRTGRQG
jgi:DNA-binding MarR family transcriptional regulator